MPRRVVWLLGTFIGGAYGCFADTSDGECERGTSGCACLGGDVCEAGLTCVEGTCEADGAGGGTSGSGGSWTDGGTWTSTGTDTMDCPAPECVADDPIVFLNFEGEGSAATDASGYEFHGSFEGSVDRGEGRWGMGLVGDGSPGWVEIPHDSYFDLEYGYTLQAWVSLADAASMGVIAKGIPDDPAMTSYALAVSSEPGVPSLSLTMGACVVESEADAFAPGDWHNVAGTWDGYTLRIMIDSVLVALSPCDQPPLRTYEPVLVGAVPGGPYVNGAIDNAAVFDHLHEPEDICLDSFGTWEDGACNVPP